MEESAFKCLYILIAINFSLIIFIILLSRTLNQKINKLSSRVDDYVFDKHHLRSELNYIYKNAKILPKEEKKRLDEFFGNKNYEVITERDPENHVEKTTCVGFEYIDDSQKDEE